MEYPVIKLRISDKDYPEILRQIKPAPKILYCRGDLSLLSSECFAIVGTRKMTPYGKEVIKRIVPDISKYFTVVSGLALGVDAYAHEITLQSGGKAIVVLGGPVSQPSPRTNSQLAQRILKEGGLMISEYSDSDIIQAFNFAVRDRIISGLSKGVLIVEADKKSGSLITASLAVEQNREVFAVPGSILSSVSSGTNTLIQKGAKLVTCTQDILDEFSMLPLPKIKSTHTMHPLHQAIVVLIKNHGPMNADEIIRLSMISTQDVLANLSIMEIRGHVKMSENGIYSIE